MTENSLVDSTGAMQDVKVLLLAAGRGARLRPLTDRTPKCLVPIAGHPLLGYWFDRLTEAGVHDVLINTHFMRDQVRSYLDRINQAGPLRITEAYEPRLLGSAGTIHANKGFVCNDEDCLIIYADNLSDVNLAELMRVHRSHQDPITMVLFRTPTPTQCGIVAIDRQGRVIEFQEKPSDPKSNLANAGVYAMTSAAYREIADLDGFDLANDVMPKFIGRMRGWIWDGYHRDVGTPESLAQARRDVDRVFGARVNRTV